MPLRGGGRSTPAPFTRGQKSRPFSPSPGKGDAELGNRSGLEVAAGRAWPWVQAGTSLGGAYPDSSPPPPTPGLWLGTLPGIWGGWVWGAAPVPTRRAGGAAAARDPLGEPRPVPSGPWGPNSTEQRGLEASGSPNSLRCRQLPPNHRVSAPKTSAGAGRGREPDGTVPEGAPRPWDSGVGISARFVGVFFFLNFFHPGRGQVPGFAFAWGCGGPSR